MKSLIKELIDTKDFNGLREILSENPVLANEGIPFDEGNMATAHPLHRICDGVFTKAYSDGDAVTMAEIFLAAGANINGNELIEKQDSPLVAAASLHADQVGILYVDHGAELNHPGCYGGTALHWAAWCGRPILVEKLLESGADINKKCMEYEGTPLNWAVHSLKGGTKEDPGAHLACIKMLIKAGAENNMSDEERKLIFDLSGNDFELKQVIV